ncbi:low specificity L-threonine aldolase [Microcoleus sp. FACHB-1515]|uniref:threonine aldolase family protein n=1 Tax=Cyanophyceae TaxID=3028117 RepID=UPI001682A899|nr:low specificity L-threonine aldolase [Microcoleus sp. FACHB-1515]MBD2089337.1 low specificity L-threonine aldolase [Microcoleus sp. FACHB-1515]
MNFCSDNVTGIAPEILAAIAQANAGAAMPYGNDEITQRLETQFSDLFETPVAVFPVATGSAANAIALSAISPVYGAIYCHSDAHIHVDECGAPEFFTGGAKLATRSTPNGKLTGDDLAVVLAKAGAGVVHHVQPAAISITQATEAGTVYSRSEVAAIAQVAQSHGLKLHMDGARFANAIVSLGCSPADITWRSGVDVLSFGATKNGAMAAEAVVFFDRDLAKDFEYRRKRGGHLFSKMRFLSAQLEAYLQNDLWLRHAAHANQMAARLAQGFAELPNVRLCFPVEANEVFVQFPTAIAQSLQSEGFQFYADFYPDQTGNTTTARLVTAFDTDPASVEKLIAALQRLTAPIEASV